MSTESGDSEMSGGNGGGGSGSEGRRPSTCRVEMGALLAPEPRPLDNKVKVSCSDSIRVQRGNATLMCPLNHITVSLVHDSQVLYGL